MTKVIVLSTHPSKELHGKIYKAEFQENTILIAGDNRSLVDVIDKQHARIVDPDQTTPYRFGDEGVEKSNGTLLKIDREGVGGFAPSSSVRVLPVPSATQFVAPDGFVLDPDQTRQFAEGEWSAEISTGSLVQVKFDAGRIPSAIGCVRLLKSATVEQGEKYNPGDTVCMSHAEKGWHPDFKADVGVPCVFERYVDEDGTPCAYCKKEIGSYLCIPLTHCKLIATAKSQKDEKFFIGEIIEVPHGCDSNPWWYGRKGTYQGLHSDAGYCWVIIPDGMNEKCRWPLDCLKKPVSGPKEKAKDEPIRCECCRAAAKTKMLGGFWKCEKCAVYANEIVEAKECVDPDATFWRAHHESMMRKLEASPTGRPEPLPTKREIELKHMAEVESDIAKRRRRMKAKCDKCGRNYPRRLAGLNCIAIRKLRCCKGVIRKIGGARK